MWRLSLIVTKIKALTIQIWTIIIYPFYCLPLMRSIGIIKKGKFTPTNSSSMKQYLST